MSLTFSFLNQKFNVENLKILNRFLNVVILFFKHLIKAFRRLITLLKIYY